MSDVMEKTKWLIHKVNLMGNKWADADDAKKNELWGDVHSANKELEMALEAAEKATDASGVLGRTT